MNTPLLDGLKKYRDEGILRFHMPGHYGKLFEEYRELTEDLFAFDVTEVPGLDDLAEPSGILKESLEQIASVYGAQKSYFLLNGSTSGIHVAIDSFVPDGGYVISARNVHKSVLNIFRKKHIEAEYIYPVLDKCFGVDNEIEPKDIRESVEKSKRTIDAVILTYPNYYGRAYDLISIHEYLREKNIPLIVDSAHGANFAFSKELPPSAAEHSEICIHSLHKTMPAFTQTSLLHIGKDVSETQRKKIEQNLRSYLSSSPSYLMMASAELAVKIMKERGEKELGRLQRAYRSAVKKLEEAGLSVYYADDVQDFCKLFVRTPMEGALLSELLRKQYKIQCEMTIGNSILFMLGISHTNEEIDYLTKSLIDCIEKYRRIPSSFSADPKSLEEGFCSIVQEYYSACSSKEYEETFCSDRGDEISFVPENLFPKVQNASREQIEKIRSLHYKTEFVNVAHSEGRILAQDIIPYPPGIPVLMKYEVLNKECTILLKYFRLSEIACFVE